MIPTAKQIQAEIEALTEIKPKVRRLTFFGDDNHKAIDAQIKVLEKDLDEDAIYDRWDDGRLLDYAQSARAWLDGESEEDSLVEGWKSLVAE